MENIMFNLRVSKDKHMTYIPRKKFDILYV